MSNRLQVLLPSEEMADIRRLAKQDHLTVGEWVRRALRDARSQKPAMAPEAKLKAVRRAAAQSFATADIDQMLREISRGYDR